MAKKSVTEQSPVEKDELDDLKLDFEDPDIGVSQEKDNRKVVRELSIGFAQGVKSDTSKAVRSLNRLKEFLPESYSTTLETQDTTLGTVTDLYQTLKRETKDGVDSLKKATKDLVKPHQDKLPSWLKDRMDSVLKTDEDKKRVEADPDALNEQAIEQTLSSIFKLQMEHAEKTKEEQTTEDAFQEVVEEKRHFTISELLNHIRQGVDRQVSYQDQVVSKVYSKQLELQFKTLHTLEKQLSVQEKFASDAKEALQAIAKNASLPEYRKLQLTESVGQSLREKFSTNAQEKITGLAGGFFQKIGGRLKEQATAYAKTLNEQLKDSAGLLGTIGDTGDMISPVQLAGMLMGGEVTEKTLKYAAPKVRDFLEKQGIVSDVGEDLQQFTDDLPRLLNQYAQNNMSGLGPKAWLADVIGDNRISSNLDYTEIEDSDQQAVFDKLTRQSIVEIIPGYLSRIHLELRRFREGMGVDEPDDTTRLGYDLKQREFTSGENVKTRISQDVFSGVDQSALQDRLTGILDSLDLRENINPLDQERVEKGLKSLLIGLHYQGKPLSLDQLTDTGLSSQFMDDDTSKILSDAVTTRYEGQEEYNLQGERSFNYNHSAENQKRINAAKHGFNRIHKDMEDPKGKIEGYMEVGYEDALRELGFVKRTSEGKPLVDYQKLFQMIADNDLPTTADTDTDAFEDKLFTRAEKLKDEELKKAQEARRKEHSKWLMRKFGIKPKEDTIEEEGGETDETTDSETTDDDTHPETDTTLGGRVRQHLDEANRFIRDQMPQEGSDVDLWIKERKKEILEALPKEGSVPDNYLKWFKGMGDDARKKLLDALPESTRNRLLNALKREEQTTEETNEESVDWRDLIDEESSPTPPESIEGLSEEALEWIERTARQLTSRESPKPESTGREIITTHPQWRGGLEEATIKHYSDELVKPQPEPTLGQSRQPLLLEHLPEPEPEPTLGESPTSKILPQDVKNKLGFMANNTLGQTISVVAKGSDLFRQIRDGDSLENTDENGEPIQQTFGDRLQRSKNVVKDELAKRQPKEGSVADNYKKWLIDIGSDVKQQITDRVKKETDLSRDDSLRTIAGHYGEVGQDIGRGIVQRVRGPERAQTEESTPSPLTPPSDYLKSFTDVVQEQIDRFKPKQPDSISTQDAIDPWSTPGMSNIPYSGPPVTMPRSPSELQGDTTSAQTPSPLMDHLKAIRQILENKEDGFPKDIRAILDHLTVPSDTETPPDEAQFAVLSRILETVEGIGQHLAKDDEASRGLLSRIGDKSAQVLGAVAKTMGSYYLGAFKLFGGVMGGLGHIALGSGRAVGQGIGSLFKSRRISDVSDVYLKDQPYTPVLTAKGFREGIYFDNVTGQSITSIDDLKSLKGNILDQEGNLVVTRRELSRGIQDQSGNAIGRTSILKHLAGGVGVLKEAAFLPYRLMWKASSAVIKKGLSFVNRVRDVYVKGEPRPRLLAQIIKNGGYVNASTGRPIFNLKDIDGEVRDRQGNIVLTLDDFKQGLVDWKGEPFDFLKRQFSRIAKVAKVAGKVAGWGIKQTGRYYGAVGRGVGSLVKGGFNLLRGQPKSDDNANADPSSFDFGDHPLGEGLLTDRLSPYAQSKVEVTEHGHFAERLFDVLERIAGCSCGDALDESIEHPKRLNWDDETDTSPPKQLGWDGDIDTSTPSHPGASPKRAQKRLTGAKKHDYREEWDSDDDDDFRDNSWQSWLHGDKEEKDTDESPTPQQRQRTQTRSGGFLKKIAGVGGAVLGFAGRKAMGAIQNRRRRNRTGTEEDLDETNYDEEQTDQNNQNEESDQESEQRSKQSKKEKKSGRTQSDDDTDDQEDDSDEDTDEDDSSDTSETRVKKGKGKGKYAEEWDSDDADDFRDNSWQAWLYGDKKKKEKDTEQQIKEEREKKKGGWLASLLAMVAPILGFIKNAASLAFSGIKKLMGSAKDLFKTIRDKLGGFIKEAGRKLLEWGKKGARGAWDLVKKGARGAKSLGGKLLSGAKTLGGKALAGAKTLGGKALAGAKTLGGKALAGAKTLGGKALSGARALAPKALTAARWLAPRALLAGKGLLVGAGKLAVGAATAVGGVLSAPVLITGAAILAVGVAGYFAWKYYKGKKQSELTKHRLLQYGIDPENEDDNAKVLMLEKKMKGNVSFQNGKITIDKSVKFAEIAKSFGVDPENEESIEQFILWLNGRFLPVYWAATQALHEIDSSKSLNELKDLSAEEQWTYFQKAKAPKALDEEWAHPYKVLESPFGSGQLKVTQEQIKQSEAAVIAFLEKERAKAPDEENTLGQTSRRERREAKRSDSSEESDQNDRQQPLTRGQRARLAQTSNEQRASQSSDPEFTQAIKSTTLTKAVSPIEAMSLIRRMEQRKCQPAEAVLYHVVGLMELTRNNVETFQLLTNEVLKEAIYDNKGVAHWEGDIDKVFRQYHTRFGVKWSPERNKIWHHWFKQRFLPAYLAYLTQIRQHYLSPELAVKNLPLATETQYNAAMVLSTLTVAQDDQHVSVWEVAESPWEDQEINRDPESVYSYIEYLKMRVERAKQGADERFVEGMGYKPKESPPPSKPVNEPTKPRGGQGRHARRHAKDTAGGGAEGNVGTTATETADQLNKDYYSDSNTTTTGVGSIGGKGAIHPGGGTGGNVNDLPDSKGDGSWKAHKDLIVATSLMAGVDPGIMATMAAIESNFRATVKNKDSSARGLYQFIDRTWRGMLNKYADKYGVSKNASRNDPKANALMGAEFLKENARALKNVVDGPVTDTHLYAAHFLGAAGAKKLFRQSPGTNAVRLMPGPAKSNYNIFYGKGGQHRSVSEVYAELDRRVDTRRSKYAEDARNHASMIEKKQPESSDSEEVDFMAGLDSGEIQPQWSPIDPNDTVAQSPVMQPTQSAVHHAQYGSSSSGGGTQSSPVAQGSTSGPMMSPVTNVGSAPSASAQKGHALLKARSAGGHVDVDHVNQGLAASMGGFIQDIEAQTGRKLSVQSAYRPPTNKEKKAVPSNGTTQASISGSPLAASTFGSMHGRGEAIDIRYSDMGSIKQMNKMSSQDKQLWYQTARKHGMQMPLLAGTMGPGTGRKGSTYLEWWHMEPDQPHGGRRGDLKLRGKEHAQHILSNAAKSATGQPSAEDNLPVAAGSTNEEGSKNVLEKIDSTTPQSVAAQGESGATSASTTGGESSSQSSPVPRYRNGKPMDQGGAISSTSGNKTPSTPVPRYRNGKPMDQGGAIPAPPQPLPHPTVRGVVQPVRQTVSAAEPVQAVQQLLDTARSTPRSIADRITSGVDRALHVATPRQSITAPAGMDSSTGIHQALNQNTEQLQQQQQQRAHLATSRVVQEEERQVKGNESLGSIQGVLEDSLKTQVTMDTRLNELVTIARGMAKKKETSEFQQETPNSHRVTSEPLPARRQPQRTHAENQRGVISFNRSLS